MRNSEGRVPIVGKDVHSWCDGSRGWVGVLLCFEKAKLRSKLVASNAFAVAGWWHHGDRFGLGVSLQKCKNTDIILMYIACA